MYVNEQSFELHDKPERLESMPPYRPHALCDGAVEYNMDIVNPGEVIGRNNDIYRSQKTVRTTLLGRNNSYLCSG